MRGRVRVQPLGMNLCLPRFKHLSTHVMRTPSSSSDPSHFTTQSSRTTVSRPPPPTSTNPPPLSPPVSSFRSNDETYAWNMVIRGLLEVKNPKGAFSKYAHMRREGVVADSHTVGFSIKACCALMGICEGQQVHGQVIRMGFDSEVVVQTTLINMYVFYGYIIVARRVFDETPQRDLPMWNAILTAYAQKGWVEEIIQIVGDLLSEHVRPNEVTCMSMLSACSSLKDFKSGKVVHGYVVRNIVGLDALMCSALVNMYAKCGCLEIARYLFDLTQRRDVVSWTTMINGCLDNDCPEEAVALFKEMVAAKVQPDEVTLLGLASMFGTLERIELAKLFDNYVREKGFGGSTRIENALMFMHAKCGNIKRACQIFDQMKARTIVSWTTIIQGLAIHRCGVEALVRFTQMQRAGYIPDELCFVAILSACNHAELVEEGRTCFRSMTEEYKITPWMEHYGSMVDMLCRAGLVNEALEFLVSMPVKPDARMLRAFIGARKDQENITFASMAL